MSSCYEQLKPYVQWAAQQQLIDPNRYVVGVVISAVKVTGEIINIQGQMDVSNAKFSLDSSRFIVQMRGIGQRHIHSLNLSASAGHDIGPDYTRVIVQLDATEKDIRVRVGDTVARQVVDDFLLDCHNDALLGASEGMTYTVSLQRLERVGDNWSFITEEQAAALAAPPAPEPAVPAEPDDLQRIEGIGPGIATALNGIGITTYAQLASYDPLQLESKLTEAGAKLVPGALMAVPAQAALAAAGRWNAVKYIQDEVLKSGRLALPDDLTKIKGIGPGVLARLDAIGITTFRQLRDADPEQVEIDLKATGLRIPMGSVATWKEQAALAAGNHWDELEQFQKELAEFHQQMGASEAGEVETSEGTETTA